MLRIIINQRSCKNTSSIIYSKLTLDFDLSLIIRSFCSETNLNFEQASKILTIAENFLNTCATDPRYSQELSVSYFREQVTPPFLLLMLPVTLTLTSLPLIVAHDPSSHQINSILLEPTAREGVILLEVKILEKFLLFFAKNFVRHLSLYQTVLSTQQTETVQYRKIAIQTPLCFPALMESPSAAPESVESPRVESPTALATS
jgi:hypothetical protein